MTELLDYWFYALLVGSLSWMYILVVVVPRQERICTRRGLDPTTTFAGITPDFYLAWIIYHAAGFIGMPGMIRFMFFGGSLL